MKKVRFFMTILLHNICSFKYYRMKRWRFDTVLLIAILSTCLVTISANNDDDEDGVTVEAEKIVNVFTSIEKKSNKRFNDK